MPSSAYARLCDMKSVAACLAAPYLSSVAWSQCGLQLSAPATYPTSDTPTAMVVADMNNDGNMDIIAAILSIDGTDQGAVVVLLGRGDGTFDPPREVRPGGLPWTLVPGDFNGDSYTDIATLAGQTSESGWLLYGDGAGNFTSIVPLDLHDATSGWQHCLAAGNLNDDGRDDLAVAGQSMWIWVLPAGVDGTFGDGHRYQVSETYMTSVCIADFNGEGHPDVAYPIGFGQVSQLGVLLRDSAGWAAPQVIDLPDATFQRSIAPIDINLDGHIDIAVAGNGSVNVIRYQTNGHFSDPIHYPVPLCTSIEGVGRVNSDQYPDLIVAVGSGNLAVMLNDTQGGFLAPVSLGMNGYVAWATADFNNDGVLDVAAVRYGARSVAVMLNTTFQVTSSPQPASACPWGGAGFRVVASGEQLTYRWQRESTPMSGIFEDIFDGSTDGWDGGVGGAIVEGADTATISLQAQAATFGRLSSAHAIRYRCVLRSPNCGMLCTDPVSLTVCAADQNCDGFSDFFDYDAFVLDYERGDQTADFNGDDFLDFFDYDEFVLSFEAGC